MLNFPSHVAPIPHQRFSAAVFFKDRAVFIIHLELPRGVLCNTSHARVELKTELYLNVSFPKAASACKADIFKKIACVKERGEKIVVGTGYFGDRSGQ